LNELASIPEVADTYLVDDFMCTEMKRRGAKELTDQDKLEQALRRANVRRQSRFVCESPAHVLKYLGVHIPLD
jgi:hypothetical protein